MLSLVEYISCRVSSSYSKVNWSSKIGFLNTLASSQFAPKHKILITRGIKYLVTGNSCQFWLAVISVSSRTEEGMNWRALSLRCSTDTEKFPDE